jgi:hypothetical protein
MSAVAARALELVGVRFRLHGRDAVHGLDCVGVVAVALARAGVLTTVPSGYSLRGGRPAEVAAMLDAVLPRGDGVGAVLLCAVGAGQLHLGIRTAGGLVHADAGLRRVVLRPGVVPWPVIGCWRAEN